jgi:hypothetical protein
MARAPPTHKICPDLLLSRCHRREKVLGWCSRDVVVFARLVGRHGAAQWNDILARYEELRRKRVDAACDEANLRWETNKDFGWLAQSMGEWLVPIFLGWSTKARNKAFEEELTLLARAQLDNQRGKIQP